MAKTVDLDTVPTVSANSTTKILVENSGGNFGYISGIFNADGGLAGVPNLKTFATKENLDNYVTIESANSTYETKEEAGSTFATKTQLNDYVKVLIKNEGNIAYMNNEANGGLIKFTSVDKKMCKVTLFDGSDTDKTYLQLIVKDEAEDGTQVAKINGNLNGFYYIKTSDNTPAPEKEIATLGDVYTRTQQEITLENGDKAKIQNQNDGGVMQYVKQDGGNNAVCVNNDSQNVGVELCSLATGGSGSRLILNSQGAYLSVGTEIKTDDDSKILTKKDLTELQAQLTKLQAENTELKTQLTQATETVNAYTAQVSQLVTAAASVQAETPVAETEVKSAKAKS